MPVVQVYRPPVSDASGQSQSSFVATDIVPFELDYAKLPLIDPARADVAGSKRATPSGLTVELCAKLAAEHSAIAAAIELESDIPIVTVTSHEQTAKPHPQQSLFRELRPYLAADARNKAAGEAVSAYYQLADVEARGDVVRKSIEALETLREAVKAAKKKGVKPPLDDDELDRQRATWIGLLGQVELGAKLLDGELRRRMGQTALAIERLLPTGDMSVSVEPIDKVAAVKIALEQRPDLLALRTAYHRLSLETLPEVRELLRTIPGVRQAASGFGPRLPFVRRKLEEQTALISAQLDAVAAEEVEIRRKQLFHVIEEKERQVADEVRAQIEIVNEQLNQIGLARWRAEKLMAKAAELKRDDKGAATVVPAELEANRARADVIQAVMNWHQARAKLTTAQGLFVPDR